MSKYGVEGEHIDVELSPIKTLLPEDVKAMLVLVAREKAFVPLLCDHRMQFTGLHIDASDRRSYVSALRWILERVGQEEPLRLIDSCDADTLSHRTPLRFK